MSDQITPFAGATDSVQIAPMPVHSPTTAAGSKVGVTVQVAEIVLSFGATRVLFRQDGEPAGSMVEYHSSHSLSPTAAKQLSLLLDALLDNYERTFGKIPMDSTTAARAEQLRSVALEPVIIEEPVRAKGTKRSSKSSKAVKKIVPSKAGRGASKK